MPKVQYIQLVQLKPLPQIEIFFFLSITDTEENAKILKPSTSKFSIT